MLLEAAKVVEQRRQAYGEAAPLMAAVARAGRSPSASR